MYRKERHDSDSGEMEYCDLIIDSSQGKYEFMIAENERCRISFYQGIKE
jgi:hypothetical protein